MGINTDPEGDSITSSWIAADGHYAFCEFRTPEEANNGFALNNVAIHGQVNFFYIIALKNWTSEDLCSTLGNNLIHGPITIRLIETL